MDLYIVGKTIRTRREAMGLTPEQLAKLANLPHQTVQYLEAGTLEDLGFKQLARLLSVLGLDFDRPSLAARQKKRGLWMAAKTSSVSFKHDLSETMLEQSLATGEIPLGFEAHLGHLLGQAPVEFVVMAVEETARHQQRLPAEIWVNVAHLATSLAPNRKELWV